MTFAKAVVAALVAFAGTLFTATIDNGVSPHEWIGALVSALAALSLVFAVPNKPQATP